MRVRHHRWRTLTAGIAAGTGLAALLACGEWLLRIVTPGGIPASKLLRSGLLIVGSAELLGLLVGVACGALAVLFARRDPARGPERAVRLTAFVGVAAFVLAIRLAAVEGRALTAANIGLALALFAAALILEAVVTRILSGREMDAAPPRMASPLASIRALLAPVVALPILVAFPRLFLGESPATVDPLWGGSAVFAGIVVAVLVLLAAIPGPIESFVSRRRVVLQAGLFTLVAFAGSYGPLILDARSASRDGRPSLLLVVVDTLRPDHLSAYGYARPTSPALDELAHSGVIFGDAVSAAAFTMPSVASLMTSRYPFEHGVRCHPARLQDSELTLAEILRREGYVTGAVVSNPLLSREWGFDQGFGSYDVVGETSLGELADLHCLSAFRVHSRRDTAGITSARAVRWLRRHHARPFFLWVHFMDPHFPYEPPPPFAGRFTRGPTPEYDALRDRYHTGQISRGGLAVDTTLAPATLAQGADLYDGEVACADSGLGRILATLKNLGLEDRTVRAFTADHGEALGEHGVNFAHTFTTFEEVVRVPLVIAAPHAARSGMRTDRQVDLLDVSPTLLSLATIAVPPAMHGRSLVPLLEGGDLVARPAYAENAPLLPGHPSYSLIASFKGMHREGMAGKWRMVRLPPWKLIHIPGRPEGEDLFFNLAEDPGELHPLEDVNPERAKLQSILGDFLSDEAIAGSDQVPAVSAEAERRLRSLGYVH